MKTLVVMTFVALLNGATPQCLTENDRFNLLINSNLSGITDFGLDLFRELSPANSTENFFFSPFSIWSALTLAYFGSEGNTETELQQALRTSDKISTLRLWRALEVTYELRRLTSVDYEFISANKMYVSDSFPLRNCIKKVLFQEVQSINLIKVSEAAKEINTFVKDKTNGKISKLMTPSDLQDAIMVLLNVAYFKASWESPFSPQLTLSRNFTTLASETTLVPMMNVTDTFGYGESSELGARVLELKYKGGAMSMFLLLPNGTGQEAFTALLDGLNGENLLRAVSNLTTKRVHLLLPRFSLNVTLREDLIEALKNTGINDLFNASSGNLSTFVNGNISESLSVSRSIHSAFVNVTETGTEAAAATAFSITTRVKQPPPKIEFLCDRPFIFFIFDNDTDNVLFLGTYKDPLGQQI